MLPGKHRQSKLQRPTVSSFYTACLYFPVLQFPLTPGLRLDEFQLRASGSLVILPDFPTHAEAERDHVVLLAVPGAAALDVIQQSRLQRPALPVGGSSGLRLEPLFYSSHFSTHKQICSGTIFQKVIVALFSTLF